MKKAILFSTVLLLAATTACHRKTKGSRSEGFVTSIDPDAECAPSPLLEKAERTWLGSAAPDELDVRECLTGGYVFRCTAAGSAVPRCEPIADARTPDTRKKDEAEAKKRAEEQAAKDKAAKDAAAQGSGSGSAAAGSGSGSGSGSAK